VARRRLRVARSACHFQSEISLGGETNNVQPDVFDKGLANTGRTGGSACVRPSSLSLSSDPPSSRFRGKVVEERARGSPGVGLWRKGCWQNLADIWKINRVTEEECTQSIKCGGAKGF
jgi:hypothetical protein